MDKETQEVPLLFRWRDAFASDQGPPSTTRHVLWALSKHMDQHGKDCYPTQEQLAGETGLNIRTVREHLKLAEKGGWIIRKKRRRKGQNWANDWYTPRIPKDVKGEEHPPLPSQQGEEPRTLPKPEGEVSHVNGEEFDRHMVGAHDPTSTSAITSKSTSEKPETRLAKEEPQLQNRSPSHEVFHRLVERMTAHAPTK